MDLEDLIETKRSAIIFSWHGNNDCFKKFGKLFLDGINKKSVTWKHDDGYPIDIKFQLKFVRFNEALVLLDGVPPCCSQIAFVHVYFFNAATVDEYRNSLFEFAEWFSQIKNGSWLVVFDSTRAREQKARGHVLEKIKSDVSGSQNRIFEINGLSDLKAVNTFITTLIANFIAALDYYSNALKSVLMTLKDDRDISSMINCQYKLCSLYWSLGMTEVCLTEIDSLDGKISGIFLEAASALDERNYTVLNSLKAIDGREECPLLSWQMTQNKVESGNSLVSLRTFVLAHQILASLFSHKLRSQNSDKLTLNSLNNYFASTLFRNVYNLLIWFKNYVFVRDSVYDLVYQNCLTIAWSHEVFRLAKHYGNFMELETTREDASKLQIMNSDAWLFLHNQSIQQVKWLQKWTEVLRDNQLDAELLAHLDSVQKNECFEGCKQALKTTVATLKSLRWHRNYGISRLKLAKFNNEHKQSLVNVLEEIVSNSNLPVSLIYSLIQQYIGDPSVILRSTPELRDKFNSYLCNIVLSSEQTCSPIAPCATVKIFNFNVGHTETNRFPFRLLSVHPSFIVVRMNKQFQMTINLHSIYNVLLKDCTLGAVFKSFDASHVHFASPSFECIMQENRVARLQCVNEGLDKQQIESWISQPSLYDTQPDDLKCHLVGEHTELTAGQNLLTFEATPQTSSNFVLSHVFIRHSSNFEFVLSTEYEKLASRLLGCFCFADIKMASIELADNAQSKVYAGIAQELSLRLLSGSMPILSQSVLKARFLDSENYIEFLGSNGEWSQMLQWQTPTFEAMSSQLLKVRFYTTINQMNYSAVDNFSFAKTLQVEWQERKWTFELRFTSILSIKTMTSILEDKMLFETEIQRCDGNEQLLIVPLEADICSINEDQTEVPADLLNDCLEPIHADSTYRLIWKLPVAKSKAPVDHNLSIKYKIELNKEFDSSRASEMQRIICSRSYLFKETISFVVPHVEYEICARILSEKPQSVICRADSTCDFVISLRMLKKNNAENVIVALEADPEHWKLVDKFKVVSIKENGLGQTSFCVVPRVGYLPYPSVFIHRFNSSNDSSSSEKDLTNLNESKLFGERVATFNRSEAKQIHVLGAYNPHEHTDSIHSTSSSGIKSFKAQAKERLQRFFES